MHDKDWVFKCCSWKDAFLNASESDYIYLDPPYIGRDTSYVGEWSDEEAVALAEYAKKTPANVCLSMWKENEFRRNEHLYEHWSDFMWYDCEHFYHIGAKESNRHPMIEVLAIKR
jgi:DNA adenine methylase